LLLGREFLRNRPPGCPADKTKSRLLTPTVHLEHHAIDVVWQIRALFSDLMIVRCATLGIADATDLRVYRESPVTQQLQGIEMSFRQAF